MIMERVPAKKICRDPFAFHHGGGDPLLHMKNLEKIKEFVDLRGRIM